VLILNLGNRNPGHGGKIPYGLIYGQQGVLYAGNPLAAFHADVTGDGPGFIGPGWAATVATTTVAIYLPHPALKERSLPRLPWGVEHPVQFVPDVAVKLRTHQPFLRGEHIVIVRVTGAGGIKKPYFALAHEESIGEKANK
jgi:hypothetical protein